LLVSGAVVKTGCGQTVRFSSTCVQFESRDYLPPESMVEIFIAWPAQLENAVALQLYVRGRTVRSQDHLIILEIQRYEFRTRRKRSPEVSDQVATRPGTSAASA
jgi:hypothetical protein